MKLCKTLALSSILALFLASSLNGFLFDHERSWDLIPDEWLPMMFAQVHNPSEAIGYQNCLPDQLKRAQYEFDNALGINTNITWKQSPSLRRAVNGIFANGSVASFLKVCQTRDYFQLLMGAYYFPCMNRYYLMNQNGATWDLVMTYLRLFWHLDFLCNQGFEQISNINTWTCIQKVEKSAANLIDQCYQQFNQTLGNPPNYNNLCPAVQVYSSCYWNLFNSQCNTPIGYYACEDIRVGYARDCRNLRCYVNSNVTTNQ